MGTKLFLQILLLAGCLALAVAVIGAALGTRMWLPPAAWWRAAMACWLLIIAVRAVYPVKTP
jgi:hypothetical protein